MLGELISSRERSSTIEWSENTESSMYGAEWSANTESSMYGA